MSACDWNSSPKVEVEKTIEAVQGPNVPAELLSCKDSPLSPGGKASDEQVAQFIKDALVAGADCRSKLKALVTYIETYNKELAVSLRELLRELN